MNHSLPHRYALFGGVLESEIALPELPPAPDAPTDGPVIARVTLGRIPDMPDDSITISAHVRMAPGLVLLTMPYNGRVLIRDTRELIVEPEGVEANARPLLYGACLAIIASGRDLLSVHASGLETQDGTVMFCGRSGAGKSTLAAALANRGYGVVADDLCHLVVGSAGAVSVWPVLQQVRLWRASADALGWTGRPSTPVIARLDKQIFPGPPQESRDPLPLSAIYLLDRTGEPEEPAIERLKGVAAADAVISNLFIRSLLRPAGTEQASVAQVISAVRTVPVFRFTYPRGFDRFDGILSFLQERIGPPPRA